MEYIYIYISVNVRAVGRGPRRKTASTINRDRFETRLSAEGSRGAPRTLDTQFRRPDAVSA